MSTAIDMIGTSLGSGTKTYNLNFCQYLIKQNLKEKIYIFTTKDYLDEIDNKTNPNIIYIIKSKIFTNSFFRILWMQFYLPFELKRLDVKQLYSPMNMGPFFLKLFDIKLILALHSNLPWVFFSKMPGNIIRNILTRFIMEVSVRACDSLIVDSEFAKDEIISLLKIKKEKIFVIYLGIDKKYLENQSSNDYIDNFHYKNYIISVLSCVKYHNILKMLKAFRLLKKDNDLDLKFVLVIQILDKKYFAQINEYIVKNFSKDEIIIFNNLDSKYLINLYRSSTFYIFSSYCEVFGLTSLEAMSQECPVIISNRSALPEINFDSAEYFDPDDEIEIKKSMEKVMFNLDYRASLINKGRNHHKKFKWENTVSQTIKVLNIKN